MVRIIKVIYTPNDLVLLLKKHVIKDIPLSDGTDYTAKGRFLDYNHDEVPNIKFELEIVIDKEVA